MFGEYVEAEGLPRKVRIPVDAQAWELYGGMPGVEGAARALTQALRKALKAPTHVEARKIMEAALDAHVEFGAGDSEPSHVAVSCVMEGRGCTRDEYWGEI
jgi:hypothetical protein